MKNLIFLFVICASFSSLAESTLDIGPILKSNISDSKKSEAIVVQAEKLIHPSGVMYAYELVRQAQKLDPQNKVAQFYVYTLDAVMKLRNLNTRMRPFVAQMDRSSQESFEAWRSNLTSQSLLAFLSRGKPDMFAEADFQKLLLEVMESLKVLAVFSTNNQNSKISIKIPMTEIWNDKESFKKCSVKVVIPSVKYLLDDCMSVGQVNYQLNSADFMGFKLAAVGMQIGIVMATAYDLDGISKIWDQAQSLSLNAMGVVKRFKALKKFGRLRNEKLLKTIPELGAEVLVAAKWASKFATSVCKKGMVDAENRPGYLLQMGVCVSNEEVQKIESVMNGKSLVITGTDYEATYNYESDEGFPTYSFKLSPHVFWTKPIRDLKDIMPSEFDQCGNTKGFSDPTASGLFPDGDAAKYYKYSAISGIFSLWKRECTRR